MLVIIGTVRLAILALVVIVAGGCARRTDAARSADVVFRTMPNPEGCYLQVWDGAQYLGVSDFINGPRDYPSLRSLPNKRSWRNRIASVRVGPTAEAMAFTNENFQGAAVPLLPGTSHPVLPENAVARIESLRVSCRARSVARR